MESECHTHVCIFSFATTDTSLTDGEELQEAEGCYADQHLPVTKGVLAGTCDLGQNQNKNQPAKATIDYIQILN